MINLVVYNYLISDSDKITVKLKFLDEVYKDFFEATIVETQFFQVGLTSAATIMEGN